MFDDCEPVAHPIRIGDKWTAKIIVCLRDAPRRFSELQAPLRGITPKVLTASLRALERDGMVTRTVFAEIPLRVEYALTPLGHTLFEPLAASCEWTRKYRAELDEARAAHEADLNS
jgi:DNA-binding HxlR family transcriptional regulator